MKPLWSGACPPGSDVTGFSGRHHPASAMEVSLLLPVPSHLVPLGHWDAVGRSISKASSMLLIPPWARAAFGGSPCPSRRLGVRQSQIEHTV